MAVFHELDDAWELKEVWQWLGRANCESLFWLLLPQRERRNDRNSWSGASSGVRILCASMSSGRSDSVQDWGIDNGCRICYSM